VDEEPSFLVSHQGNNGAPVRIFLLIGMIYARFETRWAATKKPGARPARSWISLTKASGSTRSTRPNVYQRNVN